MNLRFPVLLLALLTFLPVRAEETTDPSITVYVTRSGVGTGGGDEPMLPLQLWLSLLAETSGLTLRYQVLEFPLSYPKAIASRDSCMLGVVRLPEREADLDWIAATLKDRIVLVARQDDPFSGTLEQAAAAGRLSAPYGIVAERMRSRRLDFQLARDHPDAVRRVVDGSSRFALTVMSNLAGLTDELRQLRIILSVEPIDLWLACSRRLPADQRDRLRTSLQQLNKSPEMQKIIRQLNGTALPTPD
jgi:hypothetical protein